MKYIVCAPPLISSSGGIRVLHLLASELQSLGYSAAVYDTERGFAESRELTAYGVPFLKEPAHPDDIVICPETTTQPPAGGDTWREVIQKSNRVIWYFLNRPYFISKQPAPYRAQDLIISFAPQIDPYVPNLPILLDDRAIFHPPASEERKNAACVYFGKWISDKHRHKVDGFLSKFDIVHTITREHPASREELAELIRSSRVLVTFDCLTGLILESLLCETPVFIVDDHFSLLSTGFCGMQLPGAFDREIDFPLAEAKAKSFNAEYEKVCSGNRARIASFAKSSLDWFVARDDVSAKAPTFSSYQQDAQRGRRELDVYRYIDFRASEIALKMGIQRKEARSSRKPSARNEGAHVATESLRLLDSVERIFTSYGDLRTEKESLGALNASLQAENQELRRIVESAEKWQRRSWLKRAFHRWRADTNGGRKMSIYDRLLRSLRKRFSAKREQHEGEQSPIQTDETPVDKTVDDPKTLARQARESELDEFLRRGVPMSLPTHSAPVVSVILVLYNQAGFTYACLHALHAEHSVPLEIIIVDNASTDKTQPLLAALRGPVIIRNDQNVGFVKAVNRGAAIAKGDCILLLNNDAVVRPGSMAAAIRTIQSAPDIGAVGARLVLPDGSLQEAGSIIWKDGSCLGYGRGLSPDDYQVSFRRDVDYCSGAFLLVKRNLYEDIGGLDETYSPAYYEEVDLCVRLWMKGFRVIYEPRAIVDHFEFASSKKNEDAIALQIRNREIFRSSHPGFLSGRMEPRVENIARARHQGHARKNVLFIDDQVPIPSAGSGLPRAKEMAEVIVSEGCLLTIYPLQLPDANREAALELLSSETEIAFGEGVSGFPSFLERRCGMYDVLVVSRPHNMEVIARLKEKAPQLFAGIRIIYDAEAVFAARTICAAKLRGAPLSDEEASRLIASETALSKMADSISVVSALEARYFTDSSRDNVFILKHQLPLRLTPRGFGERTNFLFVGRLLEEDSPNADSILWFTREILPRIQDKLGKTAGVSVVGMICPELLQRLRHPAITVHGEVDDLSELYGCSRVFIAATRFSAGVPLKILEAASYGLPVVCTTLLRQQLAWEDGVELLSGETSEEFADACIRAYSDETLWNQLRMDAAKRISTECSRETFTGTIRRMLGSDGDVPRKG